MQKKMFNSKYGLEQAVLERIKTMTRRIVSDEILNKYQDYLKWKGGHKVSEREFYLCESPIKVNEVIAIAQSYKAITEGHAWAVSNTYGHSVHKDVLKQSAGWNNKMFVKADLMPHHIKITGITVERLQDISEEDCLREGIYRCEACYEAILLNIGGVKYHYGDCNHCYKTAREAFASLIDKVSGKGTWDSNPWCFCYEFKLID